MNSNLNGICREFIENRDILQKILPFQNPDLYPICSGIFIYNQKTPNPDKILESKDIHKNSDFFSSFRTETKLPIISMLSIQEDTEEAVDKMEKTFNALKDNFYLSAFLPISAMSIAQMAKEENYQTIAEKGKAIYQAMKRDHPSVITSEDISSCAIIALSEKLPGDISQEAENCYQILKNKFESPEAVQRLSQILALGEENTIKKCEKTMKIYNTLCKYGANYSEDTYLPTLGILALLNTEIEIIVRDMLEVSEFLRQQKGYGNFGVKERQRLVHANIIVSSHHINDQVPSDQESSNSIQAIAIAQQVALCTAIAMSSAASKR